eukprot:1156785-Pelagomonas_calceolata.AAC.14
MRIGQLPCAPSPSGAGTLHAGHPRHQGRPLCAIFAHVTTAAAERNWSAWACTHSFAQAAEQRNNRELVYTKVNMPASWYI